MKSARRYAWHVVCGEGERLAVLAVGGYGRGSLAPHQRPGGQLVQRSLHMLDRGSAEDDEREPLGSLLSLAALHRSGR